MSDDRTWDPYSRAARHVVEVMPEITIPVKQTLVLQVLDVGAGVAMSVGQVNRRASLVVAADMDSAVRQVLTLMVEGKLG